MLTLLHAALRRRRTSQLAFWTMTLLPTIGRRSEPVRVLLIGPDAESVLPPLRGFFPETVFETASRDALLTPTTPAGTANAFDFVVLYDVLHHAADPRAILRAARTVATDAVLVKGHTRIGWFAGVTLTAMDWFATGRHGAPVPTLDRYWTLSDWAQTFVDTQLTPTHWHHRLALYPWPIRWLADRRLHCFVRLVRPGDLPGTPPPTRPVP